jgi:hypothetical protein
VLAIGINRVVTIGVVEKHLASVVNDDVEHNANTVSVRSSNQVLEIGSSAEVRINLEEVLDAVSMKGVIDRNLLEDGAEPDGSNAEPLEIADLRGYALQVPSNEGCPGVAPSCGAGVILDRIAAIGGSEQWRGAGGDGMTVVVDKIVLVAIGEAIHQQEVERLVFPMRRRRKVPWLAITLWIWMSLMLVMGMDRCPAGEGEQLRKFSSPSVLPRLLPEPLDSIQEKKWDSWQIIFF